MAKAKDATGCLQLNSRVWKQPEELFNYCHINLKYSFAAIDIKLIYLSQDLFRYILLMLTV